MAPKKHVGEESKVYIPESIALEKENEAKFKSEVEEIRKKPRSQNKKGVVYLGHIPHGFYEQQMREFFSQFGQVTRLKLSRSKKTGGSKGYAFIEFRHEEVARVVADTMNNYLMFVKLLKCEFVPEERLHPDTFKGANRKFRRPVSHLVAAARHNKVKSQGKEAAINSRRSAKLKKTLKKLSELGVDYTLEVEDQPKGKTAKRDLPKTETEEGGAEKKAKRKASKENEKKKETEKIKKVGVKGGAVKKAKVATEKKKAEKKVKRLK